MRYVFLIAVMFLVGCQATYNAPPVTEAQASLIANPTPEILAEVEAELPAFLEDDIGIERAIIAIGRPLNERETALARVIGVRFPERVRIAIIPRIPPRGERQEFIEEYAGLRFRTVALAAGYGILITNAAARNTETLAHELVHIRQFEELGREGMARQVLTEKAVLSGITVIPIEQEAIFDSAAALGIEPRHYPF